jgi:hypothetical protein
MTNPLCLAVPRGARAGTARAAAPMAALLDEFAADSAFFIVMHLLFLTLRRAPRHQLAVWRTMFMSGAAISAADVAIGDTVGSA